MDTDSTRFKIIFFCIGLLIMLSIVIYRVIPRESPTEKTVSRGLTCEEWKHHMRSCKERSGDDYVHCLALLEPPKGCE